MRRFGEENETGGVWRNRPGLANHGPPVFRKTGRGAEEPQTATKGRKPEPASRDRAVRLEPHPADGDALEAHRRLRTALEHGARHEGRIGARRRHLRRRAQSGRVGVLVLEAPRVGDEAGVAAQGHVAGAVRADEGTIELDGAPVVIGSTAAAIAS